jgi:hypothetical protein
MLENYLDVVDMDERAVLVQHFNKAAHVRALELMRQIDSESDRRNGVLRGMRFISDLNRESKIRDPYTIDCNFSMIGKILCVYEFWQISRMHGCDVPKIAVVTPPEFGHEQCRDIQFCKFSTSIP